MRKHRWLIGGGVLVVLLIVAALYARDYYFNAKPVDLADDYRADATKSSAEITDSMDAVFDSFDRFLRASTIRRSRLRNVDDIDELRRRFLPVYRDADRALADARLKIKRARTATREAKESLLETPSARFLDDSDPIDATEAVAAQTKDYLSRTDRYLNSYEKFLDYEARDLKLRRRQLKIAAQDQVGPSDDLDAIKAKVDSELAKTQELRRDRQRLEPARDTEKLDDNALVYLNVTIDYLQATAAALDALDAAGLDQAAADYVDEVKRVGNRNSRLIAELSNQSGLSMAARSLSERADRLQNAVAVLGSGTERQAKPRRRPPLLAVPNRGGSGGGRGGGGGGSGGGPDQGQLS